MDGGSGEGNRVLEVKDGSAKGEEEIGRKGKQRSAFRNQKRNGEEEEEKGNEGGLKGGKAVNGGATFEEGVRVGGGDGLVGEGDEETEDEKVKLEVFETVMLVVVQRKRVVGFGRVRL